MFSSKPHPQARKRRRSPRIHLELLENRLQPGSVLCGLGFSLLGSSLPDLDAGLFASQDQSVRMTHSRPDSGQDTSPDSEVALLTTVLADNMTAMTANASPAQQESRQSSAPPLTSDLLALNAGALRANNVLASSRLAASRPALAPVLTQAAPVSQLASAANASAAQPTFNQAQVTQQPVAPVATAVPIPSAFLHPLSASVTAHAGPDGQNGVTPLASTNWTTYVWGMKGNASAKGVAVDSAGNSYVTGYTDDGTTRTAFVAEYDNTGKQLAFTGFQVQDPFIFYTQSEGHAVALDNAGGVYVVGKALDASAGDTDAFLMKFNANNQLMPSVGYVGGGVGGPFDDSGEGVAVNAKGEATITGTFKPSASETDIFAVKYSASGVDALIVKYFTFQGSDGSAGNAITLDSAGANAYLAGSIHLTGGDNDILVMQMDDTTANVVYTFTMTNPGDDTLNGISVDQTGQAYVVGTFAVTSGTNAFVAQVSADGSKLVNQYLIPNTQTGNAISLDPATGNAYVVANATPDAANNVHVVVQKFDKTLTPGDSLTITGNGTETGYGVAYDPNASVAYVVGTTTSNNLSTDGTVLNGISDAFLANVGSFS